jgi:hypothetical protein
MKKTKTEEVETIHGFDIPLRELTQEEATRKITLDRFNEFHNEAGEDFVDTYSQINHLILGGFLMAKHPNLSKEFLEVCNDKYGEALGLKHCYEDNFGDDGGDMFYKDFSEFINLTVNLKKRVNQILIQVVEYYNQ